MPSFQKNSHSLDFLREVSFSGLVQAVVRDMFGEVQVPPWVKFTLSVAGNPVRLEQAFLFEAAVQEHRTLSVDGSSLTASGQRRGRRIAFEFGVPDQVIREFRPDLPEMLSRWLENALKANAHKFYEMDPRIGWKWSRVGDELPKSPLLDPPGPMSRTGFVLPEQVGIESRCPFCSEEHERHDPPVWAGGNLMWVHSHCWGSR